MRVLIAIHGMPPTHVGGAERAAERLVYGLLERGHHVEVFALEAYDKPGFRVETDNEHGVVMHRLYYDLNVGDQTFRNLYDHPRIGEVFRGILAQGTFDLVHVISGYLLGGQVIHAARDAGVPVVVTLTEYWFMCARLNLLQISDELCSGPESDQKCVRCLKEDKRRYRLPMAVAPWLMDTFWTVALRTSFADADLKAVAERRQILREALDTADLVICPSYFIISKFREYGFDTSRYVFVRHGLDKSAPVESGIPWPGTDKLRLGYIGQIKPHKGIDLAVEAVIQLMEAGHPVSLDIWGPKAYAPAYVSALERRTLNYPSILWLGGYSGTKVWHILSSLDVLIVPSRWYENCPTVILEAFKMKVPVVATNLGGMAELVEHGRSGLLFELNNAADLAHQLERLLREPGLLARLRAGVPYVKSAAEEVNQIAQLYQRLLDTRR